jgi:cyclin-dependent kinase 7
MFLFFFVKEPFLPGETDLNQLVKIFDLFGTPNEINWPNAKQLPDYVEFKPVLPKPLKMVFSAVNNDTIFVLESMLQLNPSRRCNCTEALKMPYFSNAPGPTPCEQLPHPMSILEKIKSKSDAIAKNGANGKRKHSDENLGFILYLKIYS